MRTPDLPEARPGATRRGFLSRLVGAGLGLSALGGTAVLGGCDALAAPEPPPRRPHPLDPFVDATAALAARYDEAFAAVSTLEAVLGPIRDTHRRHAEALAGAIGRPAPASTAPTGGTPATRATAVAALAGAEKTARDEAVAACLAAGPRLATLLASVAAARASHLELLR